jgi:hypothetical protein
VLASGEASPFRNAKLHELAILATTPGAGRFIPSLTLDGLERRFARQIVRIAQRGFDILSHTYADPSAALGVRCGIAVA